MNPNDIHSDTEPLLPSTKRAGRQAQRRPASGPNTDEEFGPAESANGQEEPQIPSDSPPDPFDPARLRLSQDFASTVGVKKLITTVKVRKPAKSWFVRTHPDEAYRIQTAVIELKEEGEVYLIDRTLWPKLSAEPTFGPRAIFTTINRQGVVFLWPVRLPGADGKLDTWSQSAIDAATRASRRWVRVIANMDREAYDVFEAVGELTTPTWPEVPLSELLRVAFKDRFVDSLDHPVLRKLRGET